MSMITKDTEAIDPDHKPEAGPSPDNKKKKPKTLSFRIMRWVFIALVLIFVVIPVTFIVQVASDLPPMEVIENPTTDLSTQIYTADGVLIRNLYSSEHRINVKLSDISPHVLNALIATEDIRFYSHCGVDPQAFPAVLSDVLSGRGARGASTITMQLARNLYDQIGRERSLLRKLKEMIVAVILERKFTKEEIITAYLNTVSFVGNTYGIQNGARIFFQKDASELEVKEAALLVGVLKAPDYYHPVKHPERSLMRRDVILGQMEKYGFIDPSSADTLIGSDLSLQFEMEDHNTGLAPYFTEHVRLYLNEWCKKNGYDLYRDGLKVYTTIDSRFQKHAEAAVEKHMKDMQPIFDKHIMGREPWRKDTSMIIRAIRQSARYNMAKSAGKSEEQITEEFNTPVKMDLFTWDGVIEDTLLSPLDSIKYYSRFLETGFISIDPSNGHIKAWVGGINHRFFQYDHVFKGKRQVGSTFKPFVYTAAFDNGYSPCHEELNQPVFFYNDLGDEIWAPKNADGKVGGYMTLRKGLATSTNLITARLMKQIKPQVVCEYAYKMGIKSQLDCVPSLSLGTTDLSVYELTGAYCTFANQGVWNEPVFITRIEDKNGNVIHEFRGESREAISEETAYMMLNMLMGVVREKGGTAGRIQFVHKLFNEIGGKTGTTQNHSDGWFMGVTPFLVSGTWVGCSDRSMRFRSLQYGQGASLALPIFGYYMENVYADSSIALPKDPFPKPKSLKVELDCDLYKKKNVKPGTKSDNKSVLDYN